MEKYGYPPVQRPIPERRKVPSFHTRNRIKLICLFAGFITLSLWHLIRNREVWVLDRDAFAKAGQKDSAVEQWKENNSKADRNSTEWKVSLEAHIMSKCPDALGCLEQLVVPAMAQISSKVNFTLSYIGTATSDADGEGVICMHGPEECLGNIVELCAAEAYPDPKIYLGFTLCLSRDYAQIPSKRLIEDCAMEHGVDFDKLNDCASKEDGAYGMALLSESVRRSKAVGAGISCTVRLDDKVRCVRDGGEWKNCEDGSSVKSLVKDIERIWKKENGEDS